MNEYSIESLREHLPPSMIEIVDVVGWPAALKLIEKLGGVDYAVPAGKRLAVSEQLLIDAIGKPAAEAMMAVFGGSRLYIPRCSAAMIQLRNMQICAEIDRLITEGMTQKAAIQYLTTEFGVTERRIYEILRMQSETSSPQLKLL